jgi:hypothetical protein
MSVGFLIGGIRCDGFRGGSRRGLAIRFHNRESKGAAATAATAASEPADSSAASAAGTAKDLRSEATVGISYSSGSRLIPVSPQITPKHHNRASPNKLAQVTNVKQ